MPYEVKLPDIGEGVAEGEIVRWLVKPGDAVKEHQPLVEVMTDKATVEIPSPRTGTVLEIRAEEGQVVPVGTVLVSIEAAGEGSDVKPARRTDRSDEPSSGGPRGTASPDAPRAAGTPAGIATGGAPSAVRVQAAPAVRQLAKRLGVALETLQGSGPGGSVTADDVRRAAPSAPGAAPEAAGAPVGLRDGPERPRGETSAAPSAGADEPEERIPLRGLRRRIAEHMRHSLDTAAHYTFVAECDMTAVLEHREKLLARAREAGVPLTYLAYVVMALIEPLREHPLLNASLDDATAEVVLKRYYHIGIAAATDEGLTVPVIHHADRRSLLETAVEIHRLARAARAGALKREELLGGTFTITSTGARGGVLATAILHHPQVAILGVHEIKPRPAVVEDRIVARHMTNLSLSLDHRVVDGAVGADFLYAVVARLERPDSWLAGDEIG